MVHRHDCRRAFRAASEEFREAAVNWLSETAGTTATVVFRCIAANQRADALPIGLAAGVIYNAKARGKLEKAAGKMEERFLGRSAPDEATIERWNAVAAEVIRLQITDPRLKGSLLQRADEICMSGCRKVRVPQFDFTAGFWSAARAVWQRSGVHPGWEGRGLTRRT